MPRTSKAAFLVVLHLDPTRRSGLSDLLARHAVLEVVEARDGAAIEADHVYIIAPDASLTVRDGVIRSSPPLNRRGHRTPIDELFSSLAAQRGEEAICIVLSGAGEDGADGVNAIKRAGGHVIVQAPDTAKVASMPAAAIATTFADDVLSPEAIPGRIVALLDDDAPRRAAVPDLQDGIDAVLALLDVRTASTFRAYKRSPVTRRIKRRMGLAGMRTAEEYVAFLKRDPSELELLRQDLLINVTSFARDADAWLALTPALDEIIGAREGGSAFRAWVPGCATGEEAYTIAMLLSERSHELAKALDIKIFATDMREDSLATARTGVYSAAAIAGLSQARLERFFDRRPHGYRVKASLRELVVFAEHNLLVDPPFSRLDFVSCRNVMIYLDQEAQTRVLALFHFGLRDDGLLLLGAAETVGLQRGLFETVSKKWRIFRKSGPPRFALGDFAPTTPRGKAASHRGHSVSNPTIQAARLADIARRALLSRFAPASVLIDQSGRALWFHGETADYLAQPSGEPSNDIFAMARDGLRVKLRNAVRRAAAEKGSVTFAAKINRGETATVVSVTVAKASGANADDDLFLVSFEPRAATQTGADGGADPRAALTLASDDELRVARAELQETIEQFEAANEKLKAANDEVSSINEELQSANEELETSKEEMQSFNEELQTVNSELQHKVEELEEAREALQNFSSASEIATLFLDRTLKLRWVSPACEALLGIGQADIGRAIVSVEHTLVTDAFVSALEAVLQTARGADAEVENEDGRWFLRRILPYRTHEGSIGGAVVAMIDVTERKQAADVIYEERIFSEAIVQTVRHPLIVLDREMRVVSVNPAFEETFDCADPTSAGRLLSELDHGAWDIPDLRRELLDVIHSDAKLDGFKITHTFPRLGERHMRLNARKLARGGKRTALILLAIEDVTAQIILDEQRDLVIGELSHRMKNMLAVVHSIIYQTMRHDEPTKDVRDALEGRLRALGEAYDLLIRSDWNGSDLGETVRRVLAPYATDKQLTIDGAPQRLNPSASVSVALILHELATNATKHGALSSPSGVVSLTWHVGDEAEAPLLHMRWVERGGPPISARVKPGFGTKLIERSVKHQLAGSVELDFDARGLSCRISFPVTDE